MNKKTIVNYKRQTEIESLQIRKYQILQKQQINIKILQYFDEVFEYDFPHQNKCEIDPAEILTKVINYLGNFMDDFKGYQ